MFSPRFLHTAFPIAPLVSFRLVFGAVMLFSTLRFWYLGWIEEHFLQAKIHFKYFGFEWVQVLPAEWMYALHALMALAALGIMLGAFYRVSAAVFFLSFTYVQLIDLTYYLNHYYFVSLTSLLLLFVPANGRFSVDAWRKGRIQMEAPRWTILIFQAQIAIVYFYAGLAKINYAWLIEAMPLRIWAPANDTLPLIGPLLRWEWTPWVFSWAGMLYDTTIVAWLSWPRTRLLAYLSVIFFHGVTGMMFQIGVFPIVMVGATWVYFSPRFHEQLLQFLERWSAKVVKKRSELTLMTSAKPLPHVLLWRNGLLAAYFAFQLLFPWRYLLYPGNLFWTEEGYRFSWRVMLMEKAGTAIFYVKDGKTGREGVVDNGEFLCAHQEKQMSMQPDMILQYAHFLANHYQKQGLENPSVRAEVYVTLNAQSSRLLFDPQLDLTKIKDSWAHKTWISPYQ